MVDDRNPKESRLDAEARLIAIINHSDDAIVSKTVDGIITSWNRAAERMFGYSAAEAVGRPITIIIPPERGHEEDEVLRRIRRGEIVDHFETIRVRKDGTLIHISVTISPIKDVTGRIIGASKIARDITERKQLETQQRVLLAEVQRANRAKDEFLAMLGHELRNPIGAIKTAILFLDSVGSHETPAKSARGVIVRQTNHLARLVDDLLEVGRIATGKILLERRTIELSELVARTVNTLGVDRKAKEHAITLDVTPVWVDADEVRIEQIVTNLVVNALKYTPSGGSICVRVKQETPYAIIAIEDNGVGIPPHLLPNIFELFVQGDPGLDRSQGGLGIGLTLVKRLTELHGGFVEAFSEGVGRGSRFTVHLPAAKIVPLPAQEIGSPAIGSGVSHRILIVEDNDDAREMLRSLLELSGHEVFEASDGTKGVELALSLTPNIALIDVGLPGLDGYRVAEQIRRREGKRHIVLAAVTGYGAPEDHQRALDAGFDFHLVKPIDPDKIIELLLETTVGPRRE